MRRIEEDDGDDEGSRMCVGSSVVEDPVSLLVEYFLSMPLFFCQLSRTVIN